MSVTVEPLTGASDANAATVHLAFLQWRPSEMASPQLLTKFTWRGGSAATIGGSFRINHAERRVISLPGDRVSVASAFRSESAAGHQLLEQCVDRMVRRQSRSAADLLRLDDVI